MNDGYRFSDDAAPETVSVIRSVLPVFTESERPERVGSCVLATINEFPFIVTAAHVLHELKRLDRRPAVAVGGQLHGPQFGTHPDDRMDVGLIPIRPKVAAIFVEHGARFLDGDLIDEVEKADGLDVGHMLTNRYFIVGFPASNSQTRIHHGAKKIDVNTFSANLTLALTNNYPDGL
jgi:hypothetical protein